MYYWPRVVQMYLWKNLWKTNTKKPRFPGELIERDSQKARSSTVVLMAQMRAILNWMLVSLN